MKILVLGGVSLNLMIEVNEFPDDRPQTIHPERFHETVGSTGAGKAMVLKRLGQDVTFHGVIGEDAYGERIKARMAAEHIPFYYEIDLAGTEWHVNLMKKTGERISIFLHAPSEDQHVDESLVDTLIADADVVFLNIAPYCRKFLPLLKKHHTPVWCDLHSYDGESEYFDDFIEHAHVIQFSSDRNPNWESAMQSLLAKGKELVICTHGATGATAINAEGNRHAVSALPYDVVDTNGAGDNFFAGVLVGHLMKTSLATALRIGTVAAGLCVTSPELIDEGLSWEKLQTEYVRQYGEPIW